MTEFTTVGQIIEAIPNRVNVLGLSATVQFRIQGAQELFFFVSADDEGITVFDGSRQDPDLLLTMTDETLLDLAKGKFNPQTAFLTGKMEIEGDMTLAMKMNNLLPAEPKHSSSAAVASDVENLANSAAPESAALFPRKETSVMGLGKVLGFALGGMAAAAAAPILAPVGVLTLTGAVVGGGLGAAIGAAKSSIDDDIESDLQEENERLTAKLSEQEKRFAEQVKTVAERFTEHRDLEDFLIAMYAIGVAMANCDGEMHPDEKRDLQEMVSGLSSVALPERLKSAIVDLFEAPPSFNTAMLLVEKVDSKHWPVIGDSLRLIVESDGIVHENESAFLAAWDARLVESK